MTKSTKRRPWPAMAHAKPTSWQPTQGRRSRDRDAALKSQTDLDGVTFLPTQHRPLPPEPTTRLLRDVGVCGSAAVLLFSVCALIAVTMPPDVTQGVCRPSTNFCPVAYLSPTPSASPALKSAPMTTPTRSSSSPTRCVSRSSLLLSRLCPAVTIAWRAAVWLEPQADVKTLLPSPTQLSTPLMWIGRHLPALNVAWRVSKWFGRHIGQLKALPPRFDATLEWFGDFIKWKGPGLGRSQPDRANAPMLATTPPAARSQATNAPSGSRPRAADFFDATSTPQVGSVRPRQALQPSPSSSASPDSTSPPSKVRRTYQEALVSGTATRPGTAQPNTQPRRASSPTHTSPATPTPSERSNHASPSASNDTSSESAQPRTTPTVARTSSAQLPYGPASLPSTDFACPIPSCGARVSSASVVAHLRNSHSVAELTPGIITQFRCSTCPECGKPYNTHKNMADHARSVHDIRVSTRRTLSPASERQPSPPRRRTPATDAQDSPRSAAAGPSRNRAAVTASNANAQNSAPSNTANRQPQTRTAPAGTPAHRRSNNRRANSTAEPTSLDTDELKVKIREWTTTLYLTDDEVDSDGLNLHRDAMFHEVMSRSLAWCPKGAVPHVAHILSLAWGMVEANPDDIEAWKLLFALPRLLFAPFSRCMVDDLGDKVNYTQQVRLRCAAFGRGEFAQLWNAHAWTAPCREIDDATRQRNLAKVMQAELKAGLPGRAVVALTSCGVAHGAQVPDMLRAKCPQEPTQFDCTDLADDMLPKCAGSAACADQQEQARRIKKWKFQIANMRRLVAPAGDGWRVEHVRLAFEANPHAVANVLEAISSHRVPAAVRQYLATTALMALLKKDPTNPLAPPALANGIRPIGKTNVLLKICFKKLAFDATARHANLLAKYGQFGAGIRAGVEAASRGLQLLHESDVDSCTWSKDIYNAFQELSRQAILDTLREFDHELYEYFVAYYPNPRKQWYRQMDGSVEMIAWSRWGVTQGDALSALIFDIVYTLKVLKPTCEQFPHATLLAIHDDTYVNTKANKLVEIDNFIEERATAIRLRFVPKKERILQLPNPTRAADSPTDLDSHRQLIDPDTPFERSFIRCGGVAVGDPVAVVEQCRAAASEYGKHIHRLADSPLRGQWKGVLMAWCGKAMTMLNYVIRACATAHTATAALESDDHFFDALAAARGVPAELLSRRDDQDPWARRERMQLALRRGGAGAASLHRNRPAAYLGSIADTLPTLALLERLAPLLDAPHTWPTSSCPALRDAAAAWDYIAGLRDADGAPYLHRLRHPDAHESHQLVYAKLCGFDNVGLLSDDAAPSLEHLGKTAGCQLQRALSHVLMEFAYDCFNANPHIDPRAKIANAACAAIGAGAWMEVLPVEPELTMSDAAYNAAFCHRFLLPNDRLVHGELTRCHCGLRPTDLAPGDLPFSEHVLACNGPGHAGGFLARHNALLQPLKQLFTNAQYEFDTTPAHLRFPTNDKLMLDFVGRCPTDRTLSIGGDARVVAPMALSWLERAEASHRAHGRPDPHHATKLVEADKHAKYDQLCQLLNPPLRCLPAVFSDFGGIGRELYSAIIQPHFQQLYEAEVEEGKSGWAARRAKQRWLQHTSVTVANGNFRILATMHHEWRAQGPHTAPTPSTSTSAHRRSRAQAATSAGQAQNDTRLPTPPTSLPSGSSEPEG